MNTELLLSFLSKTTGKEVESLSEMLYKKADDGTLTSDVADDALQNLLALDAARVKELTTATNPAALKAEYDKGHKDGKHQSLSELEESVKKTFNLTDSKAKGLSLISEAVNIAAKSELTEDKILIHPKFLALQEEKETAIAQTRAEFENKINEITTKVERENRFASVRDKIELAMIEAGAKLPANAAAAANLKSIFLQQFQNFDFETAGDKIFLKGQDGQLLKDSHGQPVQLKDYATAQVPQFFDIEKQPGRQSPGNEGQQGANGTARQAPKTLDEYSQTYFQLEPSERQAYAAAYEQNFTK